MMHVSEQYRPTMQEMERARRGRQQKKKQSKKKKKAEANMKALWNLDNDLCNGLELEFRSVNILNMDMVTLVCMYYL